MSQNLMESITNNEAIELRELVRESKARQAAGLFVVEGIHLVESALDEAPDAVQMLIMTAERMSEVVQIRASKLGIEIRSITERNAERISDTRTPQGVFAVIRMPSESMASANSIVALDGVQDPGNVGTIIRTSSWFGVEQILMGPGTADCYSPKVLRATQGSIFNVRADQVEDLSLKLRTLKKAGYTIIGASLSSKSRILAELPLTKKYVLVLGSEAQGINPLVAAECSTLVNIPRRGKGESLNVAVSAGIILAKLEG